MLEYSLNGAWGKEIPDEKVKKALLNFGIDLEVESRRDGLSNVKIRIDEEKILQKSKQQNRVKKKEIEEKENVNKKVVMKNAKAKK